MFINKFICIVIIVYVLITTITAIKDSKIKNESEKLRLCVVEGRGAYKKTQKFCPILEKSSNIECVIGIDRLDCIRRIHKGTAHFGVFTPEDLIAARWATMEILVTSEMRFYNSPFEYEVVAVVYNGADIHSIHDLRGSRFCHPGYGLEGHWTEILANYFESLLVPKLCEDDYSLKESRIKASAQFFGPSCKAGPWVLNSTEDRILKKKFPSLCALCYDRYRCDVGDKHWGRRGALYCLTDGSGDVVWARLDDVRTHFGFSGILPQGNPNEYSYLCPDGHLQPLKTVKPCVWVAKPWPAIAAKRSHAAIIQDLVHRLSHEGNIWQNALLTLLETYHVNITTLDTTIPIEDYLDQATGFQSAYSFPSCNVPRSIVYCTTSIIEHVKCSWLQEASLVYGIEPSLQCVRTENLEHCLENTKYKSADIVHVDQDNLIKAQLKYNLTPIIYEYSQSIDDRYITIAIGHINNKINNLNDLKGKKICLPSYQGAAYISVVDAIKNLTSIVPNLNEYFSKKSCLWDINTNKNLCPKKYLGDIGAIRCLIDGGDVAFINYNTYKEFNNGHLNNEFNNLININDFKILCFNNKYQKIYKNNLCYLTWTPKGYLLINNDTKINRKNEIFNTFREMDRLFGKNYKSHTIPFKMFGKFDKKNNILFNDKTDELRGINDLKNDKMIGSLELVYQNYGEYYNIPNSSNILIFSKIFILIYIGLIIIK